MLEKIFKKKPDGTTHPDPLSGLRADLAQMEYWAKNSEQRPISLEDEGLVTQFAKEVERSSTPVQAVRVFRAARMVTISREAHNRRVLLGYHEGDQTEVDDYFFRKAARQYLGAKRFVEYKGERIFSTREGGIVPSIKKSILILLCPRNTVDRKTKKMTYGPDFGLFDDAMGVGKKGIYIWNPDLNMDEAMLPWETTRNLMFVSDTSDYLDWINTRLRPIFTDKQGSYSPLGLLKVVDRLTRNSLVEVVMTNPGNFARGMEGLRREMTAKTGIIEDKAGGSPLPRLELGDFFRGDENLKLAITALKSRKK
ncbi:MAG TPA: hypothetical protein PK639_03240 [Candidatus Woesebacteria bacterium]|nr:hypothetical protein [Candidatus Woesebacteria bacterium]